MNEITPAPNPEALKTIATAPAEDEAAARLQLDGVLELERPQRSRARRITIVTSLYVRKPSPDHAMAS